MTAIFTTDRLRARRWTPEDAEAAYAMYSDPEVMRWLGDGRARPVASIEAMRRALASRTSNDHGLYGMWALERIEDDEVVGSVILAPLEQRGPDIEIGWHLARAQWGNGYASEGAAALLRYGFDVLTLTRIIAVVYPENTRSIRVCERIGMRHEGTTRAYDHELELFAADRDAAD